MLRGWQPDADQRNQQAHRAAELKDGAVIHLSCDYSPGKGLPAPGARTAYVSPYVIELDQRWCAL